MMVEITAEDIQVAIPACHLRQAKNLAPYITARLDNVSPYDAMLQTKLNPIESCARFERWYEVFCKATDRPYESWVSGFDKSDKESNLHIPRGKSDGGPFRLRGFET